MGRKRQGNTTHAAANMHRRRGLLSYPSRERDPQDSQSVIHIIIRQDNDFGWGGNGNGARVGTTCTGYFPQKNSIAVGRDRVDNFSCDSEQVSVCWASSVLSRGYICRICNPQVTYLSRIESNRLQIRIITYKRFGEHQEIVQFQSLDRRTILAVVSLILLAPG